jgi:ribosomal protein L25 (general stress protein Ctc)
MGLEGEDMPVKIRQAQGTVAVKTVKRDAGVPAISVSHDTNNFLPTVLIAIPLEKIMQADIV